MSKKKKIIILASSVGAVVCILLAVVIYLTLGSKYRSEFFPNTTINGVDCSNLTIPEAEKKFWPLLKTILWRFISGAGILSPSVVLILISLTTQTAPSSLFWSSRTFSPGSVNPEKNIHIRLPLHTLMMKNCLLNA